MKTSACLAAAKAAGAERYASDTYRAASEAYRLANEAVGTGDYRLALNRALESRDHAQRASRTAEDLQSRARADATAALTEVTGLLARTTADVTAAEQARAPKRLVREARDALTTAHADVQEAGATIRTGDYAAASAALAAVKERVEKVQAMIGEHRAVQPAKRRSAG